MVFRNLILAAALAASAALPAAAGDRIVLSEYGISPTSLPFAVALENGYFKQQGLDIEGFIGSNGGGTSIRNMMANGMPFSEVGLPAAVAAFREGINLRIIYSANNNLGNTAWVVRYDSPIKKIADLKGRKVGYIGPKSSTEVTARLVIHKYGLDANVEFVPTGGQGGAETALNAGAVDVVPLSDPVLTQTTVATHKYRVLWRITDEFPQVTSQVGVVMADYAKSHPDTVRKIVSARKEGVDFIYAHPDAAAKIYAKVFQSDDAMARNTVDTQIKQHFWSDGTFNMRAIDNMLEGIKLSDDPDTKPVDLHAIIDAAFQPNARR